MTCGRILHGVAGRILRPTTDTFEKEKAAKAVETMEKLFQQMLEESAKREEEHRKKEERYLAEIREAREQREKDLKSAEEKHEEMLSRIQSDHKDLISSLLKKGEPENPDPSTTNGQPNQSSQSSQNSGQIAQRATSLPPPNKPTNQYTHQR